MKYYLSKEAKKEIMKSLSKKDRKTLKEGGTLEIKIKRFGRALKRWGEDDDPELENVALATLKGKGLELLCSNLTYRAWNWDPEKALREASWAIDYFVYGGSSEYKLVSNHTGQDWQ